MKNKLIYLPASILTLTTVFSGTVLSGAFVSADTTGSKPINVTVAAACDFAAEVNYTSNFSMAAGTSATSESDSSKPTVNVSCSGPDGFYVTAVGFSPDATHPTGLEGNTSLYGSAGSIPTGASGSGSYWGFKVSNATSTTTATIQSPYNNYSSVPSSATPIVNYTGAVSGSITASLKTDYKVSLAGSQAAGSYSGAVKYKVVSNE